MDNTDKNSNSYKIFLWIYATIYILAGFNHLISPKGYFEIMPQWIPFHGLLIYLSGVIEIILGILLLFPKTIKVSSLFIILMLIAFLPIHIDMIQRAPFTLGKIYVTPFIAWVRLPLQFLLIGWAYYYFGNARKLSL